MSRRVLLTDGEERSVLAAARGLAQVGYRVGVGASTQPPVAHWSRSTAWRHRLPDPRVDAEGFAAEISRLCVRLRYQAIIPGSEPSLLALSEHRDRLPPGVSLGLPPHETVLRCLDKRPLIEVAAAAGIPAPHSVVCYSVDEAVGAASAIGYPVVLKPHRSQSVRGEPPRMHYQRCYVAREEDGLRGPLATVEWPAIVQRYESASRVVALGGVRVEDEIVATAFARYSRTWPREAGCASFSETAELPERLISAVADLVGRLQWQGIFQLQLLERSDGSYAAIDFNPRPYGSIGLAIAGGANLPAIWADWLLEGRTTRARSKPGRRYRLEEAELQNAMASMLAGDPLDALRIALPKRNVTHAFFRWNDPGPFVATLGYRLGRLARRVTRPAAERIASVDRADSDEGLLADPKRGEPGPARSPNRPLAHPGFQAGPTAGSGAARREPPVPALVLGSHLTGLGVLRLLDAHGIPTYSGDSRRDLMSRSRLYRPAPRQLEETSDSARLAGYLERLPLPRAVLIPCSDAWTQAASGLPVEFRERFPASLPGRAVIDTFVDKSQFRSMLDCLDLPRPRCVYLEDAAQIDDLPESSISSGFLKPIDSHRFYKRFGVKGFWVSDRAEVRRRLEEVNAAGVGLMLQEWIPGHPTKSVFIDGFIDREGRVVATLARRRVRMEPARLGNSSLNVTIPPAEAAEARAIAVAIVEHLGHRGVFSAEFKFDDRDGHFKILEINARPYWYIGYTAAAGVDLAWMAYLDALDVPLPEVTSYRIGMYGLYEVNDAIAIGRSLASLHRPDGPVVRPWSRGHRALFWWKDPLPAAGEVGAVLRRHLPQPSRAAHPTSH